MVLGFVAEVIAWSLVARGRNVWTTMTPVLATMGVVALVVGPIAWSPDVAPGVSLVGRARARACCSTWPRASRW